MNHPWADFWHDFGETLGVALAFSVATSSFALWSTANPTVRQGMSVIASGVLVSAAATAALNGYLGWHQLLAPAIGAVSGLVAMPLLFAIMRGSKRIEDRADDLTDAAIKRVAGKEGDE